MIAPGLFRDLVERAVISAEAIDELLASLPEQAWVGTRVREGEGFDSRAGPSRVTPCSRAWPRIGWPSPR